MAELYDREAEPPTEIEGVSFIISDSCPWPSRKGLKCKIVPPPSDNPGYPWSQLSRGEVVIWIPDDPLARYGRDERVWSCVIGRGHLIG